MNRLVRLLFDWASRGTEHGQLTQPAAVKMLSPLLEANVASIRQTFASCDDIFFHAFPLEDTALCLVYLTELVDKKILAEVKSMLAIWNTTSLHANHSFPEQLRARFTVLGVQEASDFQTVTDALLEGGTVLLADGIARGFVLRTGDFKGRSITEPTSEQVVRGPREGFVESRDTNLMLVRKKIRNPDLKVERFKLGTRTRTAVDVLYLKSVASEDLVDEVRKRLSRFNLDGIIDSQYIEQCIDDNPLSPFPTIYSTERPDRVCAAILEGKVAILVDGSPFALTVPTVFVEYMYSNEDYYGGSFVATVLRWIRTFAFFIALTLPSLYLAITTTHQEMLQTPLVLRIAGFQEDLPYPTFAELLVMQLIFEIVREAGVRMPKAIGSAVTIVGTLVIGQAAVQAGLIGPLVIIVISLTALSSFILPNYAFMQVIRLLNYGFILLSALFGFMGIVIGLLALLGHMTSLRSFGIPFMAPLSPARREAWKDVIIRAPWWTMNQRPPDQEVQDPNRGIDGRMPKPPDQSTQE